MSNEERAARIRALEQKAVDLHHQGRYAEAERPLRTAIDQWMTFVGPEAIETLNCEILLAVTFRRRGDPDLAIPILERVAERLGRRPHDPQWSARYRGCINNLAAAYRFAGRLDAARATIDICLNLVELQFPSTETERTELARVLDNLGNIALEQRDYETAERSARRALALWLEIRGPIDEDVAVSEENLGAALLRQGRLDEARPHLERAFTVFQSIFGSDHPHIVAILAIVAELEAACGNKNKARGIADLALIKAKRCGLLPQHADVLAARALIAELETQKKESS